jgi:hypothetical protein
MYRVLSNQSEKHPQWIVARDAPGGPVMTHGPFADPASASEVVDRLGSDFRRHHADTPAGSLDGIIRPASSSPRPSRPHRPHWVH